MIQVIIYSLATGRVRRVIDPQVVVPNVVAFLAQAGAVAGEGTLAYTKVGNGQDTLNAWQAAVNAHTGKDPVAAQADWYVGVDGQNVIRDWIIADAACGDSLPGLTLVSAPWGADSRWTYDGATFTPPPVVKGIGK